MKRPAQLRELRGSHAAGASYPILIARPHGCRRGSLIAAHQRLASSALLCLMATIVLTVPARAAQSECSDWQQCRQLALAAAERGEYETFHDLAWRAVQRGRPRDPDLMLLLARAQSLSGRPHDGLVMLRRLAEAGVAIDVGDDEDFRRVRALPQWPTLEALIKGVSGFGIRDSGSRADPPPPEVTAVRLGESRATAEAPRVAEIREPVAPAATGAPSAAPVSIAVLPAFEEVVPFNSAGLEPGGLAYDVVSGRFLVAYRGERKIVVVNEESGRAVDLVRAESAGFHDIAAIEVDHRRGDLWVVSAAPEGSSERAASVHKLQLVSGRLLHTIPIAPEHEPARFTDMAVTRNGTLVVLDEVGHRVFRIRPGARVVDLALVLGPIAAASLATADDERTVYIAHRGGLVRANLASRLLTAVRAGNGLDIAGFTRVRWHRGTLVGIQEQPSGTWRLVRLALDQSGGVVVGLEVLDAAIPSDASPIATTLVGDDFYYLYPTVIRRVRLR